MRASKYYFGIAILSFGALLTSPPAESQDFGIQFKLRSCTPFWARTDCKVVSLKGTTLQVGLSKEDIIPELKRLEADYVFFDLTDKTRILRPDEFSREINLEQLKRFSFRYEKGWRGGELSFVLDDDRIIAVKWMADVLAF